MFPPSSLTRKIHFPLATLAAMVLSIGLSAVPADGPTATFPLASGENVAALRVDGRDWPGVAHATRDLQADLLAVTGRQPRILTDEAGEPCEVIIGTVGKSALIDRLVQAGKLDVSPIAGHWEAHLRQTVANPLPGVKQALVIAGSDKRGTIYGIYELSQQIGVSPWHWWCDLVPKHQDTLAIETGRRIVDSPAVRYRGIFLNDEAPDLTNWVRAKYGDVSPRANPPIPGGIANYGHEFYARIFEVILRLRGNYLWPAMWNNAFNEDDPDNARLADEYGIVMGTSHQEPMLRAQKEWDRRFEPTLGHWNYAKTPDVLENFWREGIRRNRDFESIVTLGLRGANDTEMAPGGPAANRTLLEHIVDRQRIILKEESEPNRSPAQMWCLYKEVQDYYEAGMRVPDDITLLWADDNWGNVRRLPTATERKRPGGAGVYYHFDYHGSPRNYQWINTSPLPKIWEQMSTAWQYGADRIWIVNVGHFKGYEFPLEFFLDLAWAPARWNGENLDSFAREFAAREFGPAEADEIAALLTAYPKLTARRKPEMLAANTYSLVNYDEAQSAARAARDLADRASRVSARLPADRRDAFYQLVLFPCEAFANLSELYLAAGRNALYAQQGRASAPSYATEVHQHFQRDAELMAAYNASFANGRWAHFMDQTHIGYTTWRDPPTNRLDGIPLVTPEVPTAAGLGVAVEGSSSSWPSNENAAPALPPFDPFGPQRQFIDVFNRGRAPFNFQASTDAPWIRLSPSTGTLGPDARIAVQIDWSKIGKGAQTALVTIEGAGSKVSVTVHASQDPAVSAGTLAGYVETDGHVAIIPDHFSSRTNVGNRHWQRIADYGRETAAMRADGPIDAPAVTPGKDAPRLDYQLRLYSTGALRIDAITSPSLNFAPDRGLRYAIALDDETPQVVTLVPQGYRAQNGNADWEKAVGDNARHGRSEHHVAQPGSHTLHVWMIDPGVVLEKLVLDLGGVRPSYLGPPETFHEAGK
ncbi:MAG TPA: glycosyl hydrolase 115 family protein [Candidatus Didemnitutus sp.]|nr:glycosyl hydrolase 115 family protein [Candidatus Didemnitutus sp.]